MMEKPPEERITDLLASWVEGDREAGNRLFTLLYAQLRRVARSGLRGQPAGSSLDTAGLIHDTYIKLTAGSPVPVENQAHFLALASKTMRQIIVDHARRKSALKRGGDLLRVSTLGAVSSQGMSADQIVALDQALEKLEAVEPILTRIVEMRYFGGSTLEETAEALAISTATAKRHWIRARAFLFQQLQPDPGR
jgi:RNA polymerase sigma factor (TIGR02999 family)